MANNGLSGIKFGVHDVKRIEIRQERGERFKWVRLFLIGEDGSQVEITAFAGDGWPELSLARDYVPQTGREADSLACAGDRYLAETREETTEGEKQ